MENCNFTGLELAGNMEGGSYGDMDDVPLTDSHVFNYVTNALTSAHQGDFVQYHKLIQMMYDPKDLSTESTCLKTLSEAVSYIDKDHHLLLLEAIFAMSLWEYNSLVMNALADLITALATTDPDKHIRSCLEFLVSNFTPPKQPRYLRNKDQVLDVVHSTFKRIAVLAPISPFILTDIVLRGMPTEYEAPLLLVMYVENMLRLESSNMGVLIGSSMLYAVVDKLIDLDVRIQWDEILQYDFDRGIFEMELEDLEGPDDSLEQNGVELCRENWIDKFFGGNETAERLDSLMVVIFEYLKKISVERDHLHRVFKIFSQSFKKTVLTAYKAKFAQFVIFYACSLDPDICGQNFADTLLEEFLSKNPTPEQRMSVIAYLASYLSRAKFFSDHRVVATLERLIDWCAGYCQNNDGDCNPRAHRVFYAGCQAFMYVLCFRIRSIVVIPGIVSKLNLKKIYDILNHSLDPLKACLPSIVEEFLRSFNLFAPRDVDLGESVGFGGVERLDMFFPFDPCLLKKSDRFIRPHYCYWSMVTSNGERDDDEEDYSSDEDAFTVGSRMTLDDDDDDGQRSDDDDLDYSVNKMSLPPQTTVMAYHFGCESRMPSRIRPSTSPEFC